jgi:hypothetical protein
VTRIVAALYVDRLGPYVSMPGVDPWFIDGRNEEQTRFDWPEAFHFHRDATAYDGPHPVVAHPPCGPWSKLAHQYEGDGKELALRAVEQVRKCGGVLEHPERSKLWEAAKLPNARVGVAGVGDAFGGYAVEVEQVAWGHPARKRTWLYLVGVPRELVVETIRMGGKPTHWCSGSRGESSSRQGGPVPPGIKVCSAQQRRRTPPLFAEWLVMLARASRV